MNVIKLHIKPQKGKLIIELPEDLQNKALEVTIESAEESPSSTASLFGLLKGKFSKEQIDEFTKEVRSEWEQKF